MNTKDAVKYIQELFNAYWGQQLKYQCGYDNLATKTPNENVPYAELNIIHVMADRAVLTGIDGKGRYRQTGYRPPADCKINFTDFTFYEDGERYRDFFRIIVKIKFDYDYFY